MKLTIIIFLCLISGHLLGTTQYPDFLIYQGDTLSIYANPMEAYFEKKGTRTIGDIEMNGVRTALWRGYIATWKLENDSLFLVKMQTDYCSDCPNEINISKEFGTKRVFANWVSSELINPYGERLKYIYQSYESLYEYEKGFVFKSGKLTRINNYDNSKSRESVFHTEPKVILTFFLKNINWQLVEDQQLTGKKRVIAGFITDSEGKPVDIEIRRGINPKIDVEAKRVIALIPEWDIYFKRGKLIETKWTLPVFFDKEFYTEKLDKLKND